jgi:hypothetical protein
MEVDIAASQWKMNQEQEMEEKTHTKKPITLPIPNIRAAQALPEICSDEEIVSTTRARSTACTTTSLRMSMSLDLNRPVLTGVDGKVD